MMEESTKMQPRSSNCKLRKNISALLSSKPLKPPAAETCLGREGKKPGHLLINHKLLIRSPQPLNSSLKNPLSLKNHVRNAKSIVPLSTKKPAGPAKERENSFQGAFPIKISNKYITKAMSKTLTSENSLAGLVPPVDPSRISVKSAGLVYAYAANTHRGIVRDYNEDRVSLLLNIAQPQNKPKGTLWPTCHFFSVYDGHGGSTCAEFLRDNLHHFVFHEKNFPDNPKEALTEGFKKAEWHFLEMAQNNPEEGLETSGSCAVAILLVDNNLYTANLGDSRIVMSKEHGKQIKAITKDHKPNEPTEFARILKCGGSVYQQPVLPEMRELFSEEELKKLPYRVSPGGLSVSRSIGDLMSKHPGLNGNPLAISAIPDVTRIPLDPFTDFVVLACDGVFDVLSNSEIGEIVWATAKHEYRQGLSIHQVCGKCAEQILRTSMFKQSSDNVTVIVVAFEAFEKYLKQEAQPELRPSTGLSNDSRNNYYKKGLFINYRSNSSQLQEKQRIPSAGKKIPSFLRSTLHFSSPLTPTKDSSKGSNIPGKTLSPTEDKKTERVHQKTFSISNEYFYNI